MKKLTDGMHQFKYAIKMKKNEATLESKIDRVLSSIFPTFKEVKVVHQKSFSIKFGHHNVSVDLNEPSKYSARAIFDILLTIGGKNVILLELKREDLALKDEDVEQGLSYARLTHPMPPITLISNGKDNWFFNTYTKEKIDTSTVDLELIQKLTNNSFELALNDFKDAVSIVLNKDYSVFSKIVNQISEQKFNRQVGKIGELNKPLCPEFIIERTILVAIEQYFDKSVPLVGVIGSAFSGKTNLLYQFFLKKKAQNNFLLYIDCNDHNYSIFQQLANHFTGNAKILITKDQIREWIINALSNSVDSKFYLLIDNFNNEIPEEIKNEIIELIDIFNGVNHHTLYTIDEYNYKKIAFVENRQYKTIIGEQSKIVKLDEFNDDEYNATNKLLHNKFQVIIEHGGHYTPEYREPRIIRQLASLYKLESQVGKYTKIIAVPDLNLLNAISTSKAYSNSIHDIYRKIAFCFLSENNLRRQDTDFSIVASGSGAILTKTFKDQFPEDFEVLIKSSTVIFRELRNGMKIIYPKMPELIAYHSIPLIVKIIDKEIKQKKSFEDICKIFIDCVTPIPYCDIAATGVLMKFGTVENIEIFSELIQELLKIPPRIEQINKGTKTLMYLNDIGHVQVNFEDNIDGEFFTTDFLPYAILSQIAGYPLRLIGNEEYSEYAFHLYLLNELGSNRNLLRRADVRSLHNMKPLEAYDWEEIGYIVSGHEGIIEPIVQSIQKCFLEIPKEIETLYNRAFKENNFPLLWRIYLALRTMINYSDSNLSNQAKEFLKKFNEYFKVFMADFFSKNITDLSEKKRIQELLLSFKIDK